MVLWAICEVVMFTMYWGAGSTLGLLTFLGYLAFVIGATVIWRGRDDIFLWLDDEASTLRRNFSRHQPLGPFYSPREESRLRATPTHLVRTFTRVTRSRLSWAALLMLLGPVLVVLDFFV
jgi:hypothetical protein